MDRLISIVVKSPARRKRYDDDAVDRLHHRYTTLIIVTFAVVVSMQHYIGRPVTCWAPAHFKGGWIKFTNNFCWVKNTYHLSYEEHIPKEHEHDKRREIIYYQWMPFILLFQAFLFYVPCLVWRTFNSKSGVDSDNILAAAEKFSHAIKGENREKSLVLITNQIDRFVASPRSSGQWKISPQRILSTITCCGLGKRFGNYLVILYLFSKILYIGNVFAQLFVLNAVLKTSYNLFGIESIEKILENRPFVNDTVFPKVTMCDFKIRILGNVQRYSVQCVLPINLYTEKMYVFLWWWMVLLLAISSFSLLVWLVRTIFSQDRLTYIRNHLDGTDRLEGDRERVMSKYFTFNYLKQDGVFLLRMIGHNTNQITVNEILASVWDNWRARQDRRKNEEPESLLVPDDATLPLKRLPDSPPLKPVIPPKPHGAIYRPNPSAPPSYPLHKQDTLDEPDNGVDSD